MTPDRKKHWLIAGVVVAVMLPGAGIALWVHVSSDAYRNKQVRRSMSRMYPVGMLLEDGRIAAGDPLERILPHLSEASVHYHDEFVTILEGSFGPFGHLSHIRATAIGGRLAQAYWLLDFPPGGVVYFDAMTPHPRARHHKSFKAHFDRVNAAWIHGPLSDHSTWSSGTTITLSDANKIQILQR